MSMTTKSFPGLRAINSIDDLKPGTVIRRAYEDGSHSAFSDTVVLGRGYDTFKGEYTDDIKLARPYLYASGTETICQTPLTGVEQYSVSYKSIVACYSEHSGSAWYIVGYMGKLHGFVDSNFVT